MSWVRLDLPVPEPEEMSRDELIVVVRRQAGQISAQAVQIAELMEANEALADRLARLEHLLSRNSGNSSNPPSKDDDPGKPAPPDKQRGRGGLQRSRGKQPGAPGTHLAWTDDPEATTPMLWPRRSATRSRRCPSRVCAGTRCTASTAAQRTR